MNGHIGCEGHKSQLATNFEKMFLPASVGGGNMLKSKRVTQKVVGSNPRAGKDFNKL